MVAFSSGTDSSVSECDAATSASDGCVAADETSGTVTDSPEPDSDGSGAESDVATPDGDVSVTASDDGTVVVSVGDAERALTRAEAAAFRRAVGDAIADRRELVRTAGEFRPDGSYIVARRGADSTGNAKVFDSFAALRALYDRLPTEFEAEQVGAESDVTGSRRHMLVRHFAEHPTFDCEVVCRNPLRAEKSSRTAEAKTAEGPPEGAVVEVTDD